MVSRDRKSKATSKTDVTAINARPATASAHVFAIDLVDTLPRDRDVDIQRALCR